MAVECVLIKAHTGRQPHVHVRVWSAWGAGRTARLCEPAQLLVAVHNTHIQCCNEKKLLVWTHGKRARSDATRRGEPCSRNAV
jgi:hypothetical protein